ncbi:hypothetical protein [Planobispora rosea]|uniref:hypothetical protein n=1 Tax=Planobispora rosea TaxID=35762 RepID=UPI00083B68BD|nr:hypothetical protein [Planobispora rosea]
MEQPLLNVVPAQTQPAVIQPIVVVAPPYAPPAPPEEKVDRLIFPTAWRPFLLLVILLILCRALGIDPAALTAGL